MQLQQELERRQYDTKLCFSSGALHIYIMKKQPPQTIKTISDILKLQKNK